MSCQRRMQGQVCGVCHCKETGLTRTSWMWEVVIEFEKGDMESQATLSLSSEWVCKPRWSRNREAPSYPAPNLMLSVPGVIDVILDIEVKR